MELNKNNYFSQEASENYFSVSQFKAFQKCEESALAELKGTYKADESTALLVGSYVDAYFSGELEDFKANHPGIVNKRTGELKADYKRADQIIERIERDDTMMAYLGGQSQVILTGELFGYNWKIKVDSLHEDKIVDLKIMRDFEPVYVPGEGKLPWIEAWGYDIQGAIYQQIVAQNNGGVLLPFYIAAATKEPVTDIGLYEIPQDRLDVALKVVSALIDHIADVKEGFEDPTKCSKCDYCKTTKKLDKPIKYTEEL